MEFVESQGIIFVNTCSLGEVDLSGAETNITFLKDGLVEDVPKKSDEGEKLLNWLTENKIQFRVRNKNGISVEFKKDGEVVVLEESMWVWKRSVDIDVTIYSHWVEVDKLFDGGITDNR